MKLKHFLLLGILLMTGCGYTTQVTMPQGIKSVYVPNFKNTIDVKNLFTYRGGLETDLTNAVISRFLYDGNLKVVSTPEAADAILEGDITSFSQSPLSFNNFEQVTENRLSLTCSIRLVNAKTGKEILAEPSMVGDTRLFLTGARAVTQDEAVRQAIADLAKDIVDRVVEDW
jgi:outer membrane lipopolysaccharide assembly protein LptE/RlpB